ncbi:hypothetical protein [Kaistia nematophila]|uniref:Uncharacterized protein n=1 Tax=Kaistia nematophila TaxID=2994654 RepID=A0A9X3E1E0_9HYPH|nr:hypothetical protein [Kaistia nematophila]MCX5569624.1 hypothetical protein [Kaistia nematophila]
MLNRAEAYLRDRRRIKTRLASIHERTPPMTAVSAPKEHNQTTIPPEAIVAVQLSQIRRAQEEAASASGTARAALSKAEGKGINLPAAKRALKIVKTGKAEDFVVEMQELLRYLNILGVGIKKAQLDLFETATTLAPIDEKAFDDGLRAGRLGEAADNPHDLTTAAGQQWIKGHYQGSEERQRVIAMQAEEESETEVLEPDEVEGDQGDIEDDAPFGEDVPETPRAVEG